MSAWSALGVIPRTVKRIFSPSLVRDVGVARDHAIRQYLLEKNRASYYEAQAQMWLALAKRHQQFLDSTATHDVQRLIELERLE